MNKVGGRGQSGLEFIMVFGFLILVLIMTSVISIQKTQETAALKTALDAQRVGTSIKDNIDGIAQQGPGYYKYFSVPNQLHGGYDYDVAIVENIIELSYVENSWSAYLISSNITYNCLSKGFLRKNRIKHGKNGLIIDCHLPNLKADIGTYRIIGNWSVLEIVNDAHVPSESFYIHYNTSVLEENFSVSALAPYQKVQVIFNVTNTDNIDIHIDFKDDINETTKRDNNYTLGVPS